MENKIEISTGIRYVSFGSGKKTLVVVPGLSVGFVTDNADVLESVFSDFADEYTVYVFDVREKVPKGYTISDMGDDLASAIKTIGLDKIYLYGCSMGGMEAIYIAGKYPELVEKLVVAASACEANDTSNRVIGNWVYLAENGKTHELISDMGKMIYSPAVYEASREVFSSMADTLTEQQLARFANTANVILNIDITKEASAIKCPVLVIGSEGDRVMTAEASAVIADMTGAEMYLYGAEYPHAVYDEAPDLRGRVKTFFS